MEPVKTVPQIGLSSNSGMCAGGNSETGAGNIFPMDYKECSLDKQTTTLFIIQNNTRKPVHKNSSPMGIQHLKLAQLLNKPLP